MFIDSIQKDVALKKNLNSISNQLKVKHHQLELLISEHKTRNNSRNYYLYRIMEIEADIWRTRREIDVLLDEYFEILDLEHNNKKIA